MPALIFAFARPQSSISSAVRPLFLAFLLAILGGLPLLTTELRAQAEDHFRVFLRDKGPGEFSPGSELYAAARAQLNDRCLERRARNLPPDQLLTIEDAPLYPPYLQALRSAGAYVKLELRWRNYALVQCDSATAAALVELEFVEAVQMSLNVTTTLTCEMPQSRLNIGGPACGNLDYGESWSQVASINVPVLHEMGIMGEGVRIGLLDSGFRWRDTRSLQHANVIAERDFIYLDDNTADEEGELPGQEGHGTLVLSALAGYDPGELIGTAPLAEFLLAKTEDLRFERHREEDNFAAAVEWIESNGADILSASLGYRNFDEGQENYPAEVLDGETSIVTQAINGACARGLVCVIAAGNTGPQPQSLLLPADAPDAISVAAVSPDGDIEAYSARGPAESGLKPDIAAQGSAVKTAVGGPGGDYVKINGTSLAAPLISGGAALLLQLHPDLTAAELRDLMYSTGSRSMEPDSAIGYGIADIPAAARRRDPVVSPYLTFYPLGAVQRVVAVAEDRDAHATLYVQNDAGGFDAFPMQFQAPMFYYADLPRSMFDQPNDKQKNAFVEVEAAGQILRVPIEENSYATLCSDGTSIPCGMRADLLPLDFPTAADEGVFPSVGERSRERVLIVDSPAAAEWRMEIASLDGRLCADPSRGRFTPGFNTIEVPTERLAAGMYLIRLELPTQAKYFSFFVVE